MKKKDYNAVDKINPTSYSEKTDAFSGNIVKAGTALRLIQNNTQSSPYGLINYLWYDMMRAQSLRSDYSYPVLHEFLRF